MQKQIDLSSNEKISQEMKIRFGRPAKHPKLLSLLIDEAYTTVMEDGEMYFFTGKYYKKCNEVDAFIADTIAKMNYPENWIETALVRKVKDELELRGKLNYRKLVGC